ncbi:MAG: anthranilate phosphoribosyltransferase [Proteobacteria bacterium]|nr:anthranilate phosphoribosyltransferase [Pseudomonadota bacterium]MBU4296184.1 anthranilate phosphoribosyltransferase [Pseudomonadota bacterium]MCG2749646.1 anthranilate phosphoribosyltransferase [Desulfobulbaceae bacterium]
MIKEAIGKVVVGIDLSEKEMVGVMNEIMGGEATQAQIGAFITALRMKGETIDEIAGAARVMRDKATHVDAADAGEILVDTVGTGGDASGTFNVSTTTSFVVAGAGLKVAKHGNRSVSSHCGSADVLEALGVDLSLSAEKIGQCIRTVGIGFMFAPMLHGAMKYAIGPRREIGIRTVFNVLGPLTNPANANVYVLGVYTPDLIEKIAHVMSRFSVKRALVVCGAGNIDEITITGETAVADLHDGKVTCYSISPEDVGLSRGTLADIKGGETAEISAGQLRSVLRGEVGPCLDMVLMNSGAALMAAGLAPDLPGGVALARKTIESGAAMAKLEALVQFCREAGEKGDS